MFLLLLECLLLRAFALVGRLLAGRGCDIMRAGPPHTCWQQCWFQIGPLRQLGRALAQAFALVVGEVRWQKRWPRIGQLLLLLGWLLVWVWYLVGACRSWSKGVVFQLVCCCVCWGGCCFGFATWWACRCPLAEALASNWLVVASAGVVVGLGWSVGGRLAHDSFSKALP